MDAGGQNDDDLSPARAGANKLLQRARRLLFRRRRSQILPTSIQNNPQPTHALAHDSTVLDLDLCDATPEPTVPDTAIKADDTHESAEKRQRTLNSPLLLPSPDAPTAPSSVPTTSRWRDRTRSLFSRGGITLEADNHVLFYQPGAPDPSGSHIRLPKPPTCHLCGASLDHQSLCLNCKHALCPACLLPAPHKRKRAPHTDPDAASADAALITRNLRVARTCHHCATPFALFARKCDLCAHLQCSRCPRDYPSQQQQASATSAPQRTYKKPKLRVRYTCERCGALFGEGRVPCVRCGHERCGRCVRDPPLKGAGALPSIEAVAGVGGLSDEARVVGRGLFGEEAFRAGAGGRDVGMEQQRTQEAGLEDVAELSEDSRKHCDGSVMAGQPHALAFRPARAPGGETRDPQPPVALQFPHAQPAPDTTGDSFADGGSHGHDLGR